MKSMLQILNKQIESPKRTDLVIKRWEEQGITGLSRDIYWRHMPSAERFYTELNASFIVDYLNIQSMATYPVIMLRDGFYGLLYFFLRNPKPIENFETLILIPSKFEFLIPKGWGKNTLLYEFEYSNNEEVYKSGIITGTPTKENFLMKTAEQKLSNSLTRNIDIQCNVYGRDRYLSLHVNEQNYFHDYKKALYKKFGFNIIAHNEYKHLDWSMVDHSYGFYNLDSDHFLIYSDYLNFVFASKGARFVNKPEELIKKPIFRVDVSPYHKIKIGNHSDLDDRTLRHLIKLKLSGIPIVQHNINFNEFAISQFRLEMKNEKKS
jgi:hypothetical protein